MSSRLLNRILGVVFAAIMAVQMCTATSRSLNEDDEMVKRYEQWIAQYGRVYSNETEKAQRFRVFKDNAEFIDSFNHAAAHPYTLATNEFADLTNEEFKSSRMGYKKPPPLSGTTPFMYENLTDLPPAVDWVKHGAVTPIKDQDLCECCWAFSAVASTEGITKIATGKLVSLSEQQLVDCDKVSQGCHGGWMEAGFKYIAQNSGITTEENYPYTKVQGACQQSKASMVAAKLSGFQEVPKNSEADLLKAVSQQPVSVAVDGGGRPFQFYGGGVFTTGCTTMVNHAVTIVGYGTEPDGKKFWLIKNSWGEGWGEKGYLRLLRESGAPEGLCGVNTQCSFPTAAK